MNLFVANQQLMNVSAVTTYTVQAISQFLVLIEDDEDDIIRREKTVLQQRCVWTRFVLLNKNRPLFARHLRMSYDSFMALLDQIMAGFPSIDEEMAAKRGGLMLIAVSSSSSSSSAVLRASATSLQKSFGIPPVS